MNKTLLHYVAVPCTEEVLDIITLFPLKAGGIDIARKAIPGCGLFIYHDLLELEIIDADKEWLLESKDAVQVLAYYANKDFKGLCTYLNTLPERPFNVSYI